MLYQGILMFILLATVFVVVGVYEYQRMRDTLTDNLDKAESISVEAYFPKDEKDDTVRYEKKIAAIYIADTSVKPLISNEDFCPTESVDSIVWAALYKEPEGRIHSGDYYITYRMKQKSKGKIIYVYDFTEDYTSYKNNIILIVMMALMVSAIVIFFTVYFTGKNITPMKAAFDKQKELVANASHELKTPLTILGTQAEILREDDLTGEQKKWVEGMEEQVERMRHLVGEMLELARFEAVRNEDSFRVFNLSELVDKVVLGTEALAFENNVECRMSTLPRAMVLADPDGMEKAIYTLMENAVKYTPSGEKIFVKLYIESGKVVLAIRNTGVALPKEEIPLLFDRFYRGDKAHTSTDNYGLGLAICQAIVEGNRGRIGCNSVDNGREKYTEFIINLKHISDKRISKKEKRDVKKCAKKSKN